MKTSILKYELPDLLIAVFKYYLTSLYDVNTEVNKEQQMYLIIQITLKNSLLSQPEAHGRRVLYI